MTGRGAPGAVWGKGGREGSQWFGEVREKYFDNIYLVSKDDAN